jgi:hypothetical protein
VPGPRGSSIEGSKPIIFFANHSIAESFSQIAKFGLFIALKLLTAVISGKRSKFEALA